MHNAIHPRLLAGPITILVVLTCVLAGPTALSSDFGAWDSASGLRGTAGAEASFLDRRELEPRRIANRLSLIARLAGYSVARGTMEVQDSESCADIDGFCIGANPDSPYLYPVTESSDEPQFGSFTLTRDQALVIIGRTPPEVRYYGVTSYLFDRAKDEGGGGALARQPIFGSLYDTLNLNTIGYDGDSPFEAFTVIVVTPNRALFEQILQPTLTFLRVPPKSVNLQEVAESTPILLGSDSSADRLSVLFRIAFPSAQPALSEYLDRVDETFQVLTLDFAGSGLYQEYFPRAYTPSGSGTSEPAGLQQSLDALVDAIVEKYTIPGQREAEIAQTALFEDEERGPQPRGQTCIEKEIACGGDNPDARYYQPAFTPFATKLPDNPNSFRILVGVDHTKTGKATYVNYALTRLRNLVGILSISDQDFAGSAAYHSGNPGVVDGERLYAYMFARDCSGISFCIEVPLEGEDPLGASVDDRLYFTKRVYLDPATNTGPEASELIPGYTLRFGPPTP